MAICNRYENKYIYSINGHTLCAKIDYYLPEIFTIISTLGGDANLEIMLENVLTIRHFRHLLGDNNINILIAQDSPWRHHIGSGSTREEFKSSNKNKVFLIVFLQLQLQLTSVILDERKIISSASKMSTILDRFTLVVIVIIRKLLQKSNNS